MWYQNMRNIRGKEENTWQLFQKYNQTGNGIKGNIIKVPTPGKLMSTIFVICHRKRNKPNLF